ncbi:MAG: nucleotidyltransferase domain-containing protein [Bacteroidetes bacterium]|nr:nucleotidyltransferase domain-containing protein [Bacteroidota bacterium]
MPESFGLKKSDLEILIAIFKKENTIEQAIIFGSRAKGNFSSGSDVDIALKGKDLTDDIVAHLRFQLNEETMSPYKFDLLNYNTISNADVISHIDRAGKIFYSK